MKSKNCRAMGSTGIRFTEEQLRRCDEKSTELGISRNEFIRDAVEFYLEWLSRESSEKFLIHPADCGPCILGSPVCPGAQKPP